MVPPRETLREVTQHPMLLIAHNSNNNSSNSNNHHNHNNKYISNLDKMRLPHILVLLNEHNHIHSRSCS